MSAQKVSMRSRDLISSMPDEVLGKILSSLPTRIGASTSVLSKRWRNLLALVDTLDFSDEIGNPRGFSDFVDTTLSLLTNSPIIKTFSLTCKHRHSGRSESSRVDKWIRTVLEGGFSELHLDSVCMNHHIESEFFTSSTLVKLTLSNEFYLDGVGPPSGLFFPKLKSLSLLSVGFWDNTAYEYLISGSPVLDELLLSYGDPSASNGFAFIPSIEVSNTAVKRLTISYNFHGVGYLEPPVSEFFRTRSLVYLDYSSYVARRYDVDFSSLVEARLDIRSKEKRVLVVEEDSFDVVEDDTTEDDEYDDDDDDGFCEDDDIDSEDDSEAILELGSSERVVDGDENNNIEDYNESGEDDDIELIVVDEDDEVEEDPDNILPDVTDLVAGISNVKTLHLSSDSLEVFHLYCKSVPVFHNLLTLSFESSKERGWQVLPLLLINSPNLETLVIKGLVHKVTDRCGDACVCIAKKKMEEVCCLSTCQVKFLSISGYGGTQRERRQMRHFLANLKCLETVKVGVKTENHREDNNANYQRITNSLTKLPRASSNCQIHFF